jgi:DNA invertase Pin-like site-specific DNA recombinase
LKAFAYYRTSSATNVGSDKDSLARQTSAVDAYAAAQSIEIVQSFYDAAVSGADAIDARPGFRDMLEAIAGNGVRLVLVETASRFARDLIVQETGHKYLKQQGIELVAVDSPTSFLDDTPTAIMVRQILGAVSQFEKAALVARLAAARRRLGKPGGKKGLSETHPGTVSRAHGLRLANPGMSLREVAALLASEGLVSSAGTPYGPKAVASMLRQAN